MTRGLFDKVARIKAFANQYELFEYVPDEFVAVECENQSVPWPEPVSGPGVPHPSLQMNVTGDERRVPWLAILKRAEQAGVSTTWSVNFTAVTPRREI